VKQQLDLFSQDQAENTEEKEQKELICKVHELSKRLKWTTIKEQSNTSNH